MVITVLLNSLHSVCGTDFPLREDSPAPKRFMPCWNNFAEVLRLRKLLLIIKGNKMKTAIALILIGTTIGFTVPAAATTTLEDKAAYDALTIRLQMTIKQQTFIVME
jgi:hypothetical protein